MNAALRNTSVAAPLVEIFSSLQGEGTRAGERHLFVRFQDCELSCRFCDTPAGFVANRQVRIEAEPFSRKFLYRPNPVRVVDLVAILNDFHHDEHCLVLTGGEPLQKVEFLRAFLPAWKRRLPVLLETAGVHWRELAQVIAQVDIVSMDVKLPSATGMRPYWEEHRRFLRVARAAGKELYVKAVVTEDTTEDDLRRGLGLVDETIPFILQPATAFAAFRAAPHPETLSQLVALGRAARPDLRVIPQLHKLWRVL